MAFHNLLAIFLATTILAISISSISEGSLASRSDMFREFFQTSSLDLDLGAFEGTKWAVLVAGSNEYWNYRHQADVCHAYQIMKRNGLKDENIIVFMYDDIAYNIENPRPGVIINNPRGKNVYPGVPKDYTGEAVNSTNLYAVLLGNKKAVKGGGEKVLKSGPKDHIFFYYADHGGPGHLSMPNDGDKVYADDLISVLEKMHASKTYEKMVIYVEACESGSMFEGLLSDDLNIYATTAANKYESSYGCYCGDDDVPVPKDYVGTCLGDLYSVSWMEDSDTHDPRKETLHQQYVKVKLRTGQIYRRRSHVMQYGNKSLSKDYLADYWVANFSKSSHNYIDIDTQISNKPITPSIIVDQRDADLFYFQHKVKGATMESNESLEAQKQLDEVISHRKHVDESVEGIVKALFGEVKAPLLINGSRPLGQPLVDDWDCLKSMVNTYEMFCGSLKTYGKKYMRAFANMCNAGVHKDKMAQISSQICASK